jgi:hypothetical protein
MKAAMLREWQTTSQAGLSPHEMHCHQYRAIGAAPRKSHERFSALDQFDAYPAARVVEHENGLPLSALASGCAWYVKGNCQETGS